MSKKSVIPFGPQHPVLPEPVHLDLVIEDEKVIQAIPNIGFVHRGLESLTETKDFNKLIWVVECTCGICSFGHGMGYAEAIEHVMNVDVPPRAKYLRSIWFEMSRVHSHLLWLGLMADAMGFESLFYQTWRIREKILDLMEAATGGRVIFSVNTIGGVLKDMDPDMIKAFLDGIAELYPQIHAIQKTFMDDYTVQTRMKGCGVLTREQAHALGCTGPTARASGIAKDIRECGYAAYSDLDFEPIVSKDGDCYARCDVRIKEIFQSFDLIRQAIGKLPEGELAAHVKGNPSGEYFMRVEQPRGEAIYYIKGSGKKFLDRMRIRTPTFANLAGLCEMLKNAELADVPMMIVTIDPCISCTER